MIAGFESRAANSRRGFPAVQPKAPEVVLVRFRIEWVCLTLDRDDFVVPETAVPVPFPITAGSEFQGSSCTRPGARATCLFYGGGGRCDFRQREQRGKRGPRTEDSDADGGWRA